MNAFSIVLLGLSVYLCILAFRSAFGVSPTWIRGAPDLGLRPTSQGLAGRRDGFHVQVTKKDHFRVILTQVDPGFTVSPGNIGLSFLQDPELRTDDAAFDARVRLAGDPASACVLLNRLLRRRLAELTGEYAVTVRDGKLEATVKQIQDLPLVLPRLTKLADDLEPVPSADLPARLRDAAAGEDHVFRRIRALDLLEERYALTRDAADVAVDLLGSTDPHLRGRAIRLLLRHPGDGRQAAVDVIRKTLLDAESPESDRREALRLLIEDSDRDAAEPVLTEWLAKPIPEADLRRGAIRACVRRQVLPPLLSLAVEGSKEHLLLIDGLVEIGDPTAQSRLAEELGHSSARVRTAAARALARLGGDAALIPISDALANEADTAARAALGDALGAVQRRLGKSQDGEVSIVELSPLEGSLSKTSVGGGEVSFDGAES
ncbi:MAG: HEAT repeat domain-containing protein [Acidobacteriota bacterium]